MAKSSPAFQFYPADFVLGTMYMTEQDVGQYIRALCYQWANGFVDPEAIPLRPAVEAKFVVGDDGMLRNERLETVRQQQEQFRENQAEYGRRGAATRWQAHGVPMATLSENDGVPIKKHGVPIKKHGVPMALYTSSSSSVSSSASSSPSGINPPTPRKRGDGPVDAETQIPKHLDTEAFRAAWADWIADRKLRRKPLTPKAVELQLEKLSHGSEQAAILAIQESIANGWQGIFPKNGTAQTAHADPRIEEYGRDLPI